MPVRTIGRQEHQGQPAQETEPWAPDDLHPRIVETRVPELANRFQPKSVKPDDRSSERGLPWQTVLWDIMFATVTRPKHGRRVPHRVDEVWREPPPSMHAPGRTSERGYWTTQRHWSATP